MNGEQNRAKQGQGWILIELSFSNFKSPASVKEFQGRFEVMFIERKLNNTFLGRIHMSQLLICILSLVFVLGPGSLVTGQETASKEPIEMSVVIMNPSKTKTQSVPIKMYLPTEVKPTDIVNPAGLDVEFDTDQSIYYLFKESVLLKPGETRTYNVEIRDV